MRNWQFSETRRETVTTRLRSLNWDEKQNKPRLAMSMSIVIKRVNRNWLPTTIKASSFRWKTRFCESIAALILIDCDTNLTTSVLLTAISDTTMTKSA